MLRCRNICLLLFSFSLSTSWTKLSLRVSPAPPGCKQARGSPSSPQRPELSVCTPQAAAGAHGFPLSCLYSPQSLIHNATKPLGKKALERKSRRGAQNKQNPAGSRSITADTARPSTPATPGILPGAREGSPGLRGAGSQPTSARPVLTAGAISAPQKGAPTALPPLPQQRAEPAWGRGAGGVSVSALFECSPLIQ